MARGRFLPSLPPVAQDREGEGRGRGSVERGYGRWEWEGGRVRESGRDGREYKGTYQDGLTPPVLVEPP